MDGPRGPLKDFIKEGCSHGGVDADLHVGMSGESPQKKKTFKFRIQMVH